MDISKFLFLNVLKFQLDNSSHALHEFAWWRADFKLESFGFINSTLETVSNYFLDEK